MNYIEQINHFWHKHEEHMFGSTEIALYFHLLNICNKCNWVNPFKRRNTLICAQLGIAKATLDRSRFKLQQAGMIDYQSNGKGDSNIKYIIVTPNGKYQMKFKNDTSNESAKSEKFNNNTSSDTSNEATVETSNEQHNINLKQKPKTLKVEEVYSTDAKKTTAEDLEAAYQELNGNQEPSEKSCAKKEFPTIDEAMLKIMDTAHWRNTKEHYSITDERRQELFKLFYEMKEDNYRIRYPSVNDMASNFYFWVDTHRNRSIIQKLKEDSATKASSQSSTTYKSNRHSRDDKRESLKALRARSGQFINTINNESI